MVENGIILASAAAAVAVLAIACGADEFPFDDAGAEEIFAASEEAVGEVESFAFTHDQIASAGSDDQIMFTVERHLQDARNHRTLMWLAGTEPYPPFEVIVADGERFTRQGDNYNAGLSGYGDAPRYGLPANLSSMERLPDETLDGARVHRIRGARAPTVNDNFRTEAWTIGLFIHADTLLLVRQEGRAPLVVEEGSASIGFRHNIWALRRGFQHRRASHPHAYSLPDAYAQAVGRVTVQSG